MEKNITYKILFAEDVSTDKEMVERLLKRNGFQFISECVDTEPEFRALLTSFDPDIILSDYQMPTFDGMRALQLARELKPDVPFVIVTGSTNEDIAVECMKKGADDYVIKQNLKRLISAIESAIEKKLIQQEKQHALKLLKDSELKYRSLVENSNDAVFLIYQDKFEFVNQKFQDLFEISLDKLNGPDYDFLSLVHPNCRERVNQRIRNTEAVDGNSDSFELSMLSDLGKELYIDLYCSYFEYKGGIAKQGVLRDISRRKALEKRNVMLSKVMEQSPISIVITDSNSNIEYVNPFFESRTGYSLDEAKGKNPRILQSGEHDVQFYQHMWQKLLKGEIWNGEIKNRHKDGSFYWENVSIAPVYDSAGRIEYFVALKEDITGIKKTLKELKIAKYKAEESDRLKTAFLANMSHEIRTPMNGIMGFIELLKEPDLSGEDKDEFIGIIQKSGDRMLSTISDLVDISILESGTISVNVSIVDVGMLVNDIYLFFANEAKVKGLEFGIINHEAPCIINSDYEKIYSILNNIVKNAIKFTLQGEVSIAYRMDENDTLFTISDTGIGILEDRKTAVFDRFVQADIRDTRGFEGSGLGLSIAKSYVELLNGKIWFESEENVGTTFYISLPNNCEALSADDQIVNLVDSQCVSEDRYNVLIVEDDETTVLLIKEIISPMCNNIYVQSNGRDAVRFVQQQKDLDLILMDIKLPDLNGFESVERIRRFNNDVKIIAQTAYAQKSDSDTAFKVGCNHYIAKPFSKAELQKIIKETMISV